MSDVISLPTFNAILVPTRKVTGLNFGGLRFQQIFYRLEPYVIVEHSDEACRRLAGVGINIKSGILRDYHWPSKYPSPFDHQRTTADFMVRNPRSFCFNDIGTSKSLTALWAADYMMNRKEMGRVLICSTLSTLHRVWGAEIFTHLMHRKYAILHGSQATRRSRLRDDVDFYIVNHEGLKMLKDELAQRHDITHVIMDEGARMRNQSTQLWKAANAVCGPESKRGVWWMTGSPMPKAPTDAWAQARIVNPKTVPGYFSRFRDQTMFKITQFKWVPKRGWEDTVYSSLKPAIRFQRSECLDLPPAMFVDHEVKMSKQQEKAYKDMNDNFVAEFNDGTITAVNEGVKLGKLLQVACGAIYDGAGENHVIDVTPKLQELDNILEEVGDKLIIFMPYKNAINRVTEHFDTKHEGLTYGVVNGGVGAKKRDEIFTGFQDGELNVIVAHPAAMAHGLTLTASNTILFWGPVDNYEIYEQAIGRITRPGQERHQYIKHLICTPIEKAVYKRLKNKENTQGLLLDMFRN